MKPLVKSSEIIKPVYPSKYREGYVCFEEKREGKPSQSGYAGTKYAIINADKTQRKSVIGPCFGQAAEIAHKEGAYAIAFWLQRCNLPKEMIDLFLNDGPCILEPFKKLFIGKDWQKKDKIKVLMHPTKPQLSKAALMLVRYPDECPEMVSAWYSLRTKHGFPNTLATFCEAHRLSGQISLAAFNGQRPGHVIVNTYGIHVDKQILEATLNIPDNSYDIENNWEIKYAK